MKETKKNKGITLIALVITIIVLLILAGVSIATLSGDNGVLTKASDSKVVNSLGEAKDEINLKVAEAMSDYYEGVYLDNTTSSEDNNANLVNTIMQKLNKEFDGKESTDYIISSGGISGGAMIVIQSKADPTIRTVGTMQENGSISWTDKFKRLEPVESQGLAKDILEVTVSGNTVTSPYYVNYPSAKGTIKCRVLYNDDTYGLQLISVNPVTRIKVGKNDPNPNVQGQMGSLERTQSSYNRAILTLNEKAEEYKGTADGSILAIDARCVGSEPLNKNHPDNLTGDARTEEMFISDHDYMSNYNGKYFKTDTHYETDNTRLEKIGAKGIDSSNSVCQFYFYASRFIGEYGTYGTLFSGTRFIFNDSLNSFGWWNINWNGIEENPGEINGGLRPVFKISPNVKIIGGEGTEAVPYEIGI